MNTMDNTQAYDIYSQLIERYTDQEARLPDAIRHFLENSSADNSVEMYAYLDLNESLQLTKNWVVLTASYLAVFYDSAEKLLQPLLIPREEIAAVDSITGLSCSKTVYSTASASYSIHYSHRQRETVAALNFALEQAINSQDVKIDSADFEYAKSTTEAIRNAQAAVSPSQLTVVWRLLSYLKPYRRQLAIGMTAAVVMTLLTLISPYLTKYLIDDVYYPHQNGTLAYEQAMSIGAAIIGTLILVFILREVTHWIRLRTMSVLGEFVAHDIRKELYAHIQQLNVSFFSKKQTGSIISRVSSDTDRLWDFLAFGVVEVTLSILMLIGLTIVLLVLDWRLGVLVIAPVPLILWSFKLHSKTLARMFTRAWRKWSRITEVLSDTIPGIRVVKAFNQESREKQRFDERNSHCVAEFNNIHRVWTRFWPRVLLALHFLVIVVWTAALPRLIQSDDSSMAGLSIGTFLAFVLYLNMFFYPMETIGMLMRMLNRATSSANRVFEILDTEPDFKQPDKPHKIEQLIGDVKFDNVSFAYDAIKPVLSDISFDVKAGEMIGLVGESGAGKSTVMNLLARFYLPREGVISIDNVDLREIEIGSLRQKMGMVLQDPFLFHGSILDNIRYGNQKKSLDEVIEAAIAANSHDFICRLPYGYETIVGERGHTLSGGERQRISIARAILTNPRILILDEATSSVDSATERKIQDALDRLIENRTVFAIAHRLSTLKKADRIIVLDKGKIAEQGTHSELLSNDEGIYYRLVRLQHEIQVQHFV